MHPVRRSKQPNEYQLTRMVQNLQAKTGKGRIAPTYSMWDHSNDVQILWGLMWGEKGYAIPATWPELQDKYFEIMGG